VTLGEVREVKDAWPPYSRLFIVPDEDSGWCAVVEYLPRRDRAGDFLTCLCPVGKRRAEDAIDGSPDPEPECPHLRAVVHYLIPSAEARRRMEAGHFVD
jgi:hypothetical protein